MMSRDLFELLTEARIREWEERKEREGDRAEPERSPVNESFDRQLLREITGLLEKAERTREDLKRARELQIQLMASLEKRGLPLTAKRITDELDSLRNQLR